MKPKITYVTDALCGWCFGFSPVMAQLQDEYKDRIDFDIISGGLFLDGRVGLINEVAPYIKAGAYKQVESHTGVKFGEAFLQKVFTDGQMMLDSRPPAVAMAIVKEQIPDQAIPYVSMLLNAFYIDGMDSGDLQGYATRAEQIGLDKEDFLAKMVNPTYQQMAQAEFNLYRNSGISGFPSLILELNGKRTQLTKGYVPFNKLTEQLESLLI